MVLSHRGHPAMKISTFFLPFVVFFSHVISTVAFFGGHASQAELMINTPNALYTTGLDCHANFASRTAPPATNPIRKGPYPRGFFARRAIVPRETTRNPAVRGSM